MVGWCTHTGQKVDVDGVETAAKEAAGVEAVPARCYVYILAVKHWRLMLYMVAIWKTRRSGKMIQLVHNDHTQIETTLHLIQLACYARKYFWKFDSFM